MVFIGKRAPPLRQITRQPSCTTILAYFPKPFQTRLQTTTPQLQRRAYYRAPLAAPYPRVHAVRSARQLDGAVLSWPTSLLLPSARFADGVHLFIYLLVLSVFLFIYFVKRVAHVNLACGQSKPSSRGDRLASVVQLRKGKKKSAAECHGVGRLTATRSVTHARTDARVRAYTDARTDRGTDEWAGGRADARARARTCACQERSSAARHGAAARQRLPTPAVCTGAAATAGSDPVRGCHVQPCALTPLRRAETGEVPRNEY